MNSFKGNDFIFGVIVEGSVFWKCSRELGRLDTDWGIGTWKFQSWFAGTLWRVSKAIIVNCPRRTSLQWWLMSRESLFRWELRRTRLREIVKKLL